MFQSRQVISLQHSDPLDPHCSECRRATIMNVSICFWLGVSVSSCPPQRSMHLRQPGVIISTSKNQDHTLKSPIWSKPALDCLLSNAGHCKIITLLSQMLMKSSHTLAVLPFRALRRISPGVRDGCPFACVTSCSTCVSL